MKGYQANFICRYAITSTGPREPVPKGSRGSGRNWCNATGGKLDSIRVLPLDPGVLTASTKARATPKKWKNRRWTFDEMAAELPESNLPVELWDGELVMSPSPTFRHQKIVTRFYKILDAWVEKHQLGETAVAPLDMVLTERRVTQPDVVFISNERLGIIDRHLKGAVDLVAEVISPESRRRDRIDKRDLYEQHGVREYWLIDPEAGTVEVLHAENGAYQLAGRWRHGETALSRLLDGFEVPVAELFSEK